MTVPNEEFEKLVLAANPNASLMRTGNGEYLVSGIQKKLEGYLLRQPEIDALKEAITDAAVADVAWDISRELARKVDALQAENTGLKAEVEKLRVGNGATDAAVGPDEYYLQDKRQYVGNDMLFWAKEGGYTTDLRKAEVFTREAALRQHSSRDTDVPWPRGYIHSKSRPAVDIQHVKRGDAEASMRDMDAKPAPKFPNVSCSNCGGEFGPGDHGFSHCENHQGKRRIR